MVRAPQFEMIRGLKKGAWSLEEDRKLAAYVHKYGISNWRAMPEYAGLMRCGKSCRLRWMNYLRPEIKRGNFTKEEEEIILQLHRTLGNKWSTIAAKLPGRTDNDIKNYWHTRLKRRSKDNLALGIKSEEVEMSNSSANTNKFSFKTKILPILSPNEVPNSMDIITSPCLFTGDYGSFLDLSEFHPLAAINKVSSEVFEELASFETNPISVKNWFMENVEAMHVDPEYLPLSWYPEQPTSGKYDYYSDLSDDFWSGL